MLIGVRLPWLKRALDVAIAGSALAVGAPIIAGTALAVWLDVGRPILFRQARGGLGNTRFTILKFRTMRAATDKHGKSLSDMERLTRVGAFLRASSLDELPQLWNVLRGDMSIVGPRPFIADYLDHYTAEQRRRHEVRPGITGWAQVRGRNGLSWAQKIELDVWYVDHWNLALDLSILAQTVVALVKRTGINASTTETMARFDEVS